MIHQIKKGAHLGLSMHFDSSEFDCKCAYENCTLTYVDDDLILYLEKKRKEINAPIKINSGFRCTAHNRDVGGKQGSIHLSGKAADIVMVGGDITKKADLFKDADGLGIYPGRFLHVDVRGYKARWKG